MEQLNFVWNLELHHNSLQTYRLELNKLENESIAMKTEKKLFKTKNNLEKLKVSQAQLQNKLRGSERKLRDYNFKVQEIEEALYNGQTKDIKQLEHLSREKDNLKEIIDNTETKTIEFMEEMETINGELSKMEELVDNILQENNKLKKHIAKMKEELIKKIGIEEDEIGKLELLIDKKLLDNYIKIRRSKGTAIVKVYDNICSGCNMVIPTILIDRLNSGKDIVYCESCGRILCKL